MNRTDYILGTREVYWADTAGPESLRHILSEGRTVRRRARLDRDAALRLQSMPMRLRYRGWRRLGEPKGYAFSVWSPWMTASGYRARLHLAVLSGSEFAAWQLTQALADDAREVA